MTNKAWRTIKRRLDDAGVEPIRRDGNADIYDAAIALAAIYAPETDVDRLDAFKERARRDKEAADKLALENAETRGDIARLSVIEAELAAMFAEIRTNALGLPSKLAPTLVGLNAGQIQRCIDAAMYELLNAISNYQPSK